MEWTSSEVIGVIAYLLPGFLAAWVFYGLTAHPKTTPFERVVQALIFTAIVQGVTSVTRWALGHASAWWTFGVWTSDVAKVWSLINAVIVGVGVAVCVNNDVCHLALRWLRITKRTSHPSEWFSSFSRDRRFVILHLKGERRLHGWPEEWPDQPDSGHFLIDHPKWILDDNDCVPLHLVDRLLIPASEVEMVEFMLDTEKEVKATEQEIVAAEEKLVALQLKGDDDDGKQSSPTIPEQSSGMRPNQRFIGQRTTENGRDNADVPTSTPKEIVKRRRRRRR